MNRFLNPCILLMRMLMERTALIGNMQDYIDNNQEEVMRTKGERYWYEVLPWLFLLVALPITYFIWQSDRTVEFKEKESAFQAQLVETANQLTNQIKGYEQALYGLRIFYDASEHVTEQEFEIVVYQMLNEKQYAGLRQVGFLHLVNPLRWKTYQNLRPEFQQNIKQLDPLKSYAPLTHLVNKHGDQNLALGTDAFKQNQLRRGLESAALHNRILLSKPVGVKQANSLDMSMALPVYYNVLSNSAQSRSLEDTQGWVFFNLDLDPVYSEVFKSSEQAGIRFTLHRHNEHQHSKLEHESTDAPTFLFRKAVNSEHSAMFSDQMTVEMFGQDWDLHADSLMPFEDKLDYSHANKIGLLGFLITATLTSILFLLVARLRTFDRLKEVNHRLKLSDERWRFALEGSGDGVWDWDIENDRIDYSKRWKEIFGFKGSELSGTVNEWESLLHPDDRQLVVDTMYAYLHGEIESYSLEYRLKCKDGTWKWILSRGMVVERDEAKEPIRMVGTHTDISQLKESEEQIWQHANFDYLTNLPNRRMLYTRLEREIANTKRSGNKLALLFLDLDGFKEINDTLGHDQGDVLLQQAGARLTECSYQYDVVARLGGDEFIVLISDVSIDELHIVESVAQEVLDTLAEPFILKNEKAFVTASMGIAIFPDDSSTIDGLIKNVDHAMYASKTRGGNCFTYFTPLMQEKSINRLHLSNDLRVALETQQLFIEYQPVVNLRNGEIYKAEALLRWQHPERGLVSPAEFIPIAEDTRLINEIGHWVFIESVKQCKAWRKTLDARFQVAVNKSAVQFVNADSKHATWTQHLPFASGEGNAVVVEITESLLLEASEQVTEKLREYRSQGIQIALDDFGTGYSSLSYLRTFEIDYLKIDRSFVANLADSAADRVLCKSIIEMAHGLGIQVIAEGIETKEQQDILFEAGCDYGQGYYFAKPLSPQDLEAYVESKVKAESLIG